jgi:hypothetical protein
MRRLAPAAAFCCFMLGAVGARAQLVINSYGDVGYDLNHAKDPTGATTTTNTFSSPRVELFLSETQGRLAFLAETMFEVGDDNGFAVDVERVEVAYLFSEYFRLRAGRFHTAIGYYNDAYHHGRYFQTTVDRPEMVRFEDEGGIIPAHSVGIHADGRFPLGTFGSLRYDVDLANGRGHVPSEITNLRDANNAKAYNLRLRIEPAFLDGLIIGGNVYVDTINATDAAMLLPPEKIDELILGAHLVYLEKNIHFIAEYLHVSHKVSATGYSGSTQAGFVEVGYTFDRWTPYYRFQRLSFPAMLDLFYAQNALAPLGSFDAHVVGVRFGVSDFIAFKLEGGYTSLDAGGNVKTGAAQCAFAF